MKISYVHCHLTLPVRLLHTCIYIHPHGPCYHRTVSSIARGIRAYLQEYILGIRTRNGAPLVQKLATGCQGSVNTPATVTSPETDSSLGHRNLYSGMYLMAYRDKDRIINTVGSSFCTRCRRVIVAGGSWGLAQNSPTCSK